MRQGISGRRGCFFVLCAKRRISLPMTQHNLTALLAILTTSLFVGCSDPADKVHKSAASEPQKPAAPAAPSAKEYVVRGDGSTIGFVGSKVTGKHNGGFKNFTGAFNVSDGKIVGSPEIRIAMKSIWADNDRLTGHLKSADFFDVAKFPIATFTATAIEPEGSAQKVTGNLNLHGVAKSVSFPANIQVADDALTVKAEFAINRKDFN